jgi:hypothetical protein
MEGMSLRWRQLRLPGLVVLVGVLAAVPIIRGSMLRAAGRALVVDEPLEPVDAIVVPQWAGAAGAIDAADLVRGGIAPRVMLLPEPSTPAEQELTRRGIPYVNGNATLVRLLYALGVTGVEVIADSAAGTEAEGRVLLSWCDRRQVRSIIVVSSPDHSRRLRRVLHRALRSSATKVIVRSARYSAFAPDSWWMTRDGARTEIVELQKLLFDVVRHPIS